MSVRVAGLARSIIRDIWHTRKVKRSYLPRLYFGVRWRGWHLAATDTACFSLFGTFTQLRFFLTLSHNVDRLVNGFCLDGLPKRL